MNRLIVKLGKDFIVLKCEDLDRIESERNYLRLYQGDMSYLVRDTLSDFEKKLDPEMFVRVNRSTIVNIERIKKIESDIKSNYYLVLTNDIHISWGRKFRDNLKKVLYN